MYYNIIIESTGDDDDIIPPTRTSQRAQGQRNIKN